MEQWVGILLGLIVVVAFVVAYMYRSSNFKVAPPNVISSAPAPGAPLSEPEAPAPAPEAPAPAPEAPAPAPEAPAPAPMAAGSTAEPMGSTRLSTTPVPPSVAPPPSAPSFGVSTFVPDPMSGEFEPAYEGEYAEIEENKLQDTQ